MTQKQRYEKIKELTKSINSASLNFSKKFENRTYADLEHVIEILESADKFLEQWKK